MMRATIITVNYFSGPLIRDIELLAERLDGVEIVVVDNSGEFTTSSQVSRICRPGANIGFGAACNLGVDAACSEIVIFLNPDAIIDAAGLEKLIQFADQSSRGAIWGPVIFDRSGRIPILTRPGRMGLAFSRRHIDPPSESEVPVLYVSGACLTIRTSDFIRYGGFCDRIFMYGEDLDLCMRADAAGAPVLLLSDVSVRHAGGRSSASVEARFKRLGRSVGGHYIALRQQGFGRTSASVNAAHLASGVRV